jgi:hypothetical protein
MTYLDKIFQCSYWVVEQLGEPIIYSSIGIINTGRVFHNYTRPQPPYKQLISIILQLGYTGGHVSTTAATVCCERADTDFIAFGVLVRYLIGHLELWLER